MARLWVLLAAVFAITASAQDDGAARPSVHLQAARYVWTRSVDGQTRQHGPVVVAPAREGPVYLWLFVRGDSAALDYLQHDAKGAIPIFVFWIRRDATGIYSDPADVVQLNVSSKDSVGLLAAQLESEGSFSWRVWSGKTNARPGLWRVRVVDKWGNPLACPTDTDAAAECDLELEVSP